MQPTVTRMISLLEGMATTRAIRRYTHDQIPEDDLATILWHATRAPSGSNRRPFRFLVLRDSAVAREATAVLGRSFRKNWGAKQRPEGYDAGSGADMSRATTESSMASMAMSRSTSPSSSPWKSS
jgi:nitroreductase